MTKSDSSQSLKNRPAFVVRPASPEDVAEIVTLDRQIWGQWANPTPIYRQLIDLFSEIILVAHSEGGAYAGCAVGMVRLNPSIGWVLSIDIAESFRGQGLGKQFLACLMDEYCKHEIDKVFAIIDPENIASQKLFASFGFSLVGIEKDYFGPGKDQGKWQYTRPASA